MDEANLQPTTSTSIKEDKNDAKGKSGWNKKSVKKKIPEVKHTLTSYKRMLKANPLLKYEIEGKVLPPLNRPLYALEGDKESHKSQRSEQSNLNAGKPLLAKVQRCQSLKNPSTNLSRPIKQKICKNNKTDISTQDTLVSSSGNSIVKNHKDKSTKIELKPIKRSLSAEHYERKKNGISNYNRQTSSTKSVEDIPSLRPSTWRLDISPIAEVSRESSIIFKTPSAYERRSVIKSTPKSALASRRSIYRPTTPLPSLNDLQKRLNDWLLKRGKSLSSFHHLKYFGVEDSEKNIEDEENKENIEVNQDLDKGSYEDLKIDTLNCKETAEFNADEASKLNEQNSESIAKAALEDLYKLIQDGYPRQQCEGWLELIRQKYRKLEEEPQYWECRAAIEQSRGNISNAVQCYRTAIVQGAEIQSVDESLDILLQKFSLLNISTKDVENEKSIKERERIVKDARNVFKSSIIQFAVQERKLKKNGVAESELKLVATPVRRSTRLSRSAYTSTPGIKLCSSLQELEVPDIKMLDFINNKALI